VAENPENGSSRPCRGRTGKPSAVYCGAAVRSVGGASTERVRDKRRDQCKDGEPEEDCNRHLQPACASCSPSDTACGPLSAHGMDALDWWRRGQRRPDGDAAGNPTRPSSCSSHGCGHTRGRVETRARAFSSPPATGVGAAEMSHSGAIAFPLQRALTAPRTLSPYKTWPSPHRTGASLMCGPPRRSAEGGGAGAEHGHPILRMADRALS
jgi:hypothetical protein